MSLVPSDRPAPTPFNIGSVADRRTEPRLSAEVLGLNGEARLTLGVHVRVVNVSRGGALLDLGEWLRPGTRTELRLSRPIADAEPSQQLAATAVVARCWVHRLSPLRYRTALVFSGGGRPATPGSPEAGDDGFVEVVLHEKSA
jgi:hypothetical protein